MAKGVIKAFFTENIPLQRKIYKYVPPFTKPLKAFPQAESRVKRARFTLRFCFHLFCPPARTGGTKRTLVKRARFTLLSALGKAFRGLVEGGRICEKLRVIRDVAAFLMK
jgi:hypothetical protein